MQMTVPFKGTLQMTVHHHQVSTMIAYNPRSDISRMRASLLSCSRTATWHAVSERLACEPQVMPRAPPFWDVLRSFTCAHTGYGIQHACGSSGAGGRPAGELSGADCRLLVRRYCEQLLIRACMCACEQLLWCCKLGPGEIAE